MHTEYCDCVLAALHAKYCDCSAMSLWHQVFLVLCIVYCVPGIRSVVYWVLGLSYIGHQVIGYQVIRATASELENCTLYMYIQNTGGLSMQGTSCNAYLITWGYIYTAFQYSLQRVWAYNMSRLIIHTLQYLYKVQCGSFPKLFCTLCGHRTMRQACMGTRLHLNCHCSALIQNWL